MSETKPRIYVGKFRGLKLPVFGKVQTLKCTLEIEARSAPADPELFFLFWKFNGRPACPLPYPLDKAQQTARGMFVEQVEPWRLVNGEKQ